MTAESIGRSCVGFVAAHARSKPEYQEGKSFELDYRIVRPDETVRLFMPWASFLQIRDAGLSHGFARPRP